ncbi:MAG TPA: VOC family protein [Cellulomonas sp.]
MSAITPFLWFEDQALEAAEFYVSVFPNSRVVDVVRMGEGTLGAGSVLTVSFVLDGTAFSALNGGPRFAFTEAVSFVVSPTTQAEIDDLWARLTDGGEPGQCGWLKDRYGLSWQVVPPVLVELLADPDPEVSSRVMQAMLTMGKIDVAGLVAARDAG